MVVKERSIGRVGKHYVNQSRGEAGVEAANGENIVVLQSV